jgi:tungstate transport system substrate-binding protein
MSKITARIVVVCVLVAGGIGAFCLVTTKRSNRAIEAAASAGAERGASTAAKWGTPEDGQLGFGPLPITAPGASAASAPPTVSNPTAGPTVRVAVIGGMSFTGFWNDLAIRYEKERGVHVQLIATGEKSFIADAFTRGGVDVITMHASDTIMNLVADGYAMDPQPWMRNDLVIVGPADDPAGIRGTRDAAAALRKIAAAKAPFVVHSSLGAQEVLVNILEANQIVLDPAQLTILFDDRQRSVLQVAGQKHAYTLVGRIPFRTGRLPNNGLELMVQGDVRLQRPYVVAVANPGRISGVHLDEARAFAAYLRSAATQRWIAGYGRGLIDDLPLFFPVALDAGATTTRGASTAAK